MTAQEGLRNVPAGRTSVCSVGDGHDLYYRGYPIAELAAATTFEEVAHLLLRGTLPGSAECEAYRAHLATLADIPGSVQAALELLPLSAHPMDVLRSAVSQLGANEVAEDSSLEQALEHCERILVASFQLTARWHAYSAGRPIPLASPAIGLAASMLEMLNCPKSPAAVSDLDRILILYAEHEFNASTFAARVVTATQADCYSAVTAAIGALKGPLHGGANEAAMRIIASYASPAEAATGIRRRLAAKEKIMGFGHAVYKNGDPRSPIVKETARRLAHSHPEAKLFAIAEMIEQVIWDDKGLFPNLDFYAACAYHFLGVPTALFTPLFVCARLAGWGAHIIEQRASNRLIRPSAIYVGPAPRSVPPVDERA